MHQSNPDIAAPATLQYESTASAPPHFGNRPLWVYVLVVVYALLIAGILALATYLPLVDDDTLTHMLAGAILVLLMCGASLIVVPVRAVRQRPVSRGSLWVPI